MAPMPSTRKIDWDPATVFNLDVNSHTFHCLGRTVRGDICKRPVKQHYDRDNASRLLEDLRDVSPKDVTISDLMEIASWLLCTTNHRKEEQKRIKAHAWYKELEYFIAYGVSQHQAALDAQKTRRQIASEQALQDALQTSQRLTQELREAHVRLVTKEAESSKWEQNYKMMKMMNKALEVENAGLSTQKTDLESNNRQLVQSIHGDREAAALEKARLEGLLGSREAEIKQLKTRNALATLLHECTSTKLRTQLADEKRTSERLLDENRQKDTVIEAKDGEIEGLERSKAEQVDTHKQETEQLQGELATRKAELTISRTLATNATKKLHQRIAASSMENTELKTRLKELRTKSHCQAFIDQIRSSFWQNRCHEAQADNEALLDQQRKLQQTFCEVSNELQANEVCFFPTRV